MFANWKRQNIAKFKGLDMNIRKANRIIRTMYSDAKENGTFCQLEGVEGWPNTFNPWNLDDGSKLSVSPVYIENNQQLLGVFQIIRHDSQDNILRRYPIETKTTTKVYNKVDFGNFDEIDVLKGNAKAFAEACYSYNTVGELLAKTTPDKSDCETWGITAQQWRDATRAALVAMVVEEGKDPDSTLKAVGYQQK